MIKVNLVPAEILAKARQRQLLLQASLLGGLLVIAMALVSVGHWFGLHQLNNEYKYKESTLQKLSAIVSKVEELEKASSAVRARLGVIDSLLKGRAFYPLFLSEFAGTVPPGVTVTNVTTAVQPDGSLTLAITATAGNNDDIAAWLRTLGADTHFSKVELGAVHASGKDRYGFSIGVGYALKL